MLDKDFQHPIFIVHGCHSSKQLSHYRFVMKLCVKFATYLYIFVEGQVDNLPLFGQKQLTQLDLILPNISIQFNKRHEHSLPLMMFLHDMQFLHNDVDIVGALDGFVVEGVYFVGILLQHVDISHEGLLLELMLVDHEDGDGTVVGCGACEKMHVVLG
jgi:hypothetical protein